MLLQAAGIDVQTFEARNRLGGRIQTVRRDGLTYEAGAEWIDADHFRVLGVLSELGIEPLPGSQWPGRVMHQGHNSTEDLLWSDALEDELRIEAAARELCRGLKSPPWSNGSHDSWDKQSLRAFIEQNTRTERGRWWVSAKHRSDEGDDPEKIGMLGWLCGFMHYLNRDSDAMSAYRAPQGLSQVCELMAAKMRIEPMLGHVLQRVGQHEGGIRLEFDQANFSFDRVILTMPPPVLEQIVFDPPLSASKRCAIEAAKMSRAIKIALVFDHAWWLDKGWNGRMYSDGPLQQTWDSTLGGQPVLAAYICGDEAERWTKLADPVCRALKELGHAHPEAEKHFMSGEVHDWIGDPYSKGAFSHLAPGFVLGHMEHLPEPEGRIHFSGEHTALYSGFVEGALESAERVVQEVVDDAKPWHPSGPTRPSLRRP